MVVITQGLIYSTYPSEHLLLLITVYRFLSQYGIVYTGRSLQNVISTSK